MVLVTIYIFLIKYIKQIEKLLLCDSSELKNLSLSFYGNQIYSINDI